MRTALRLRLEMGAAAAAFCRAHPDSNPRTAPVAARLIELSERAEALWQRNVAGTAAAATAVVDKVRLRHAVWEDLQGLLKIARQAARRHDQISVHHGDSLSRAGETEFCASARAALSQATALLDTLAPYGLCEEHLAGIAQGIAAYEAAIDRKHTGLSNQVEAGAGLVAVASQIMGVVSSLDAVHAFRFKDSPSLLAAWKSARNVPWPSGKKSEDPAEVAPVAESGAFVRMEGSEAA